MVHLSSTVNEWSGDACGPFIQIPESSGRQWHMWASELRTVLTRVGVSEAQHHLPWLWAAVGADPGGLWRSGGTAAAHLL